MPGPRRWRPLRGVVWFRFMTSTLPAVAHAADSAAPTTATSLTDDQLDALRGRLGADRVRRGVRLAQYTSFRIGGPADAFYTARTCLLYTSDAADD